MGAINFMKRKFLTFNLILFKLDTVKPDINEGFLAGFCFSTKDISAPPPKKKVRGHLKGGALW